jgi:hypothetical protein
MNRMTPRLNGTARRIADRMHVISRLGYGDSFFVVPALSQRTYEDLRSWVIADLQHHRLSLVRRLLKVEGCTMAGCETQCNANHASVRGGD